MGNKNTFMRTIIFATLLLASLLVIGSIFPLSKEGDLVKTEGFLPLVKPVFAQSSDPTFLEQEAGISLYTKVEQSLDLSKAKSAFRTVEKETSSYIIGSVSLPNLPETDDVHSYVQKDGWIVIYYLKDEPASKIVDFDWYSAGNLVKTKLQTGLEKVCDPLGVTPTSSTYFHFQYPNANQLIAIIDNDSFRVKIPSDLTVYERSISMYTKRIHWYNRAYIDGVEIGGVIGGDEPGTTKCWKLTASQLTPDAFHTISMEYPGEDYVAIVFVYKES